MRNPASVPVLALCLALASIAAAQQPGSRPASIRMPDGLEWTAANLDVAVDGWRLPTNDEWAAMAKHYGGVFGDSADDGRGAYAALVAGGSSGFEAAFGGRRDPDGTFARVDAHAFYWTASSGEPGAAWVYNFGGQRFLNRHSDVNPETALSARCVR